MKKVIKVNFCDWWDGFKKDNNSIINELRKYYDVQITDQPDFLFYSVFGVEHLEYDNCVKIFKNGENVIPNFNECDYGEGPDYIDFGDRYFRHNNWFVEANTFNRGECSDDLFNRKFCNFIYSNATSGEGAILRQEFCKKLMQYKPVDCPGKVLNNMSAEELEPRNGDWWKSKIDFLKRYKFTIAFENSSSDGYTTEKLLQPLQSMSIPIYWGNPLVVREFNPKAFINCNDYDNDFDAIISRIKELDNDPDKYLAMLRENPMQPNFDFDQKAKYNKWLLDIIEKGNKPFNKNPRLWIGQPYIRTVERLKQENQQLQARINELNNLAQGENKAHNQSTLSLQPKDIQNREYIEWTNTWIEDATNADKKRMLIIGDSVARQFRSNISSKLANYAVDFIGTSQSFEDPALYRICDSFFAEKAYKYSLILLNLGGQHGLYLHTKNNKEDEIKYVSGCTKFVQYINSYAPQLVLLTTTPNVLRENPQMVDQARNAEIQYRNTLQKQIATAMHMPVIDLYSFVLKQKFEFVDVQHFANPETQDELDEFIISELKKQSVILD